MKKVFFLLSAFLVFELCLLSFKLVIQSNTKDIYPPNAGSIVRLVIEERTYCSGTVIDDTTILTAAHCVVVTAQQPLTMARIEVRKADNAATGIFVSGASREARLDRAVLRGDFKSFQHSKYISDVGRSIASITVDSNYITCGYPLGGSLYCGKSTYLNNWDFMLAMQGVLIPGMSGGPTMLEDGTVIGINSAVLKDHILVAPTYNIDLVK